MFPHLLHDAHIKTGLKAADTRDVFTQLLEAVPDWKLGSAQKKNLQEVLKLRESYGTTAMGDGVALPHAFCEDVSEPLVILGISREGVDFKALDGEAVHVMFLLVLPAETADSRKLKGQILRQAHRFFSDSFLRNQLRKMESPAEVQEFMARAGSFSADLQAVS